MRKLLAVILSVFLIVLGIASTALAAPEESWKIVGPVDGTVVTSSEVTLKLDPGLMKIVPPGLVVAGEGHWHFLLDGKDVAKGPTNEYTYKGLTAGKHVLRVELHNGDHSPYVLGASHEVTINVVLAPPTGGGSVAPQETWKIISPANGSAVSGTEVTLKLDPGQMKIVKPGAVVAGEGHWHFLLDGQDVAKGPTNEFTFKGLTAGKHVLRVELHNGDHSPYATGAFQEVTVNVALPNTGANTTGLALGGILLLGLGAYVWLRKAKHAA